MASSFIKNTPTQMFSCEYCEISRSTYFKVYLRTNSSDMFWTVFRKWLFRTLFLYNHFQKHPDSVILQKYQSLSNQSFKRNSGHILSLNLTLRFLLNLGFICLPLKVTTQKANACSPRIPCFIKRLTLCISLDCSDCFVYLR